MVTFRNRLFRNNKLLNKMLPNVIFSKWSVFGIENLLIWWVSEWFLALYQFRNKILPNNHFAKYKIGEWIFAKKVAECTTPQTLGSKGCGSRIFHNHAYMRSVAVRFEGDLSQIIWLNELFKSIPCMGSNRMSLRKYFQFW